MEPIEQFCEGLRALGYEPEVRPDAQAGVGKFVVFDYEIEIGPRRGEIIRLGLQVPPDWPMSPPSGPFVSPHLLPVRPESGRGRPWDNVHEAQGRGVDLPEGEWQYWSRPFPGSPGWGSTEKTVATYLRHIRTLVGELPEAEPAEEQAAA